MLWIYAQQPIKDHILYEHMQKLYQGIRTNQNNTKTLITHMTLYKDIAKLYECIIMNIDNYRHKLETFMENKKNHITNVDMQILPDINGKIILHQVDQYISEFLTYYTRIINDLKNNVIQDMAKIKRLFSDNIANTIITQQVKVLDALGILHDKLKTFIQNSQKYFYNKIELFNEALKKFMSSYGQINADEILEVIQQHLDNKVFYALYQLHNDQHYHEICRLISQIQKDIISINNQITEYLT